jgi:PPK2 family polyphosphate:nucleotide phosphotransferase
MNYSELFRVKPGSKVKLDDIDPNFTAKHKNQESVLPKLEKFTQKLRDLQYLLYAEGKQSLLICLQALDGGGKDGTIKHVFWTMNAQGARVHGFKVPSKEEAEHDFLWRIHRQAPARGEVVIFNRSHYEDVLVVRVHNLVPKDVWSKRYEAINDFEKNLVANATHILKFYLHISPDEQLRRFRQRLDDPTRHWKISESDYSEREFWNQYKKAYEDAMSKTSTKHAPWFIIPSNHKWFRTLAVSKIVVEKLESLHINFPAPTVDINDIKRKYHKAWKEGNQGKPEKQKKQDTHKKSKK